ncbi:MAG: inositol monophosphatase [Chloroflexota bacterium]
MTSDSQSSTVSDANLELIERSVVRAVEKAGQLVSSRFGTVLEISNKGERPGKDLVTDVDKASQKIIEGVMEEDFPDHMLLGEEDPPDEPPAAADWLWVVDPIDGTTNFVNSSPEHAISAAVLYRGEPVVAAIWIPWPNSDGNLLMHARKGNGARIGDQKISVHPGSESGQPAAGVLSGIPGWLGRRFAFKDGLAGNLGETRIGGSACYQQFMVANGSMQYAITGVAHTWDFAAALLLVKEAGGEFRARNEHAIFKPFDGWSTDYANNSKTYERLRKWRGLILSGSPKTVDYVASHLEPRKPGIRASIQRGMKNLFGRS